MFSSSSSPPRRGNADGTVNIHCFECGTFICKTYANFTRAICEMCRRVANGEALSMEAVAEYEQLKEGQANVSLLVLPEVPKGRAFTLSSMVGTVMQAIGFKKLTNQASNTESAKLARSKKRGRLLESVDLGSMTDIDAKLNVSKQRGE